MLDLIFIGAIAAPFVGLGGVTVGKKYKKKKKEEAELFEYNWHFPESYWNRTGVYPVSYLLMEVAGEQADFKSWMGEVKRYEGNYIESEEIQERFWLNLVLVNEKYEAYKKKVDEYDRHGRFESKQFLANFRLQLDALKMDIIDRCHDCFELMKQDSIAERQERLALPETAPLLQLEVLEERFVASEEKALLKILESPVASFEMKAEAKGLLDKWRALHVSESRPSAEEDSMRIDLLTIRNIIEGKAVKIDESPVLSGNPEQ